MNFIFLLYSEFENRLNIKDILSRIFLMLIFEITSCKFCISMNLPIFLQKFTINSSYLKYGLTVVPTTEGHVTHVSLEAIVMVKVVHRVAGKFHHNIRNKFRFYFYINISWYHNELCCSISNFINDWIWMLKLNWQYTIYDLWCQFKFKSHDL